MGTQTSHTSAYLLKLTSNASVATALVLIAVKGGAWFLSNSVSLLASLIDSVMDSAASLINLFAIRYALLPADEKHRFGHGKAEALAGLGQAAFIIGSALFLMLQAVERLIHPQEIPSPKLGILVMLFSMLCTAALVTLQKITIRKTGSTAIRADSLHYLGDLLMNASVILALLVAHYGYVSADAWFGILIAFFILRSAWQIGVESFHHVIDREVSDAVRREILRIATGRDGVWGVHDLRTRQSGQQMFVQLHLEMSRDLPLWQAHDLAEAVENAVRLRFPNSDVIVHEDPVPPTADGG
jgi:ferrous-iron efflux pump FieF